MIEGAADPGLYDYAPYRNRKKVVWPGGKTVAVWVAPNLEYYEIDPPAHPKRKAWARRALACAFALALIHWASTAPLACILRPAALCCLPNQAAV